MQAHDNIPIIQQAIQLSIAPVFLLTGVAALLAVMANRLARIIDRARDLDRRGKELDQVGIGKARREVVDLERRRRYAIWAINFCTSAALLVCLVIDRGRSCFLAEVYSATHTSRIDAEGFAR